MTCTKAIAKCLAVLLISVVGCPVMAGTQPPLAVLGRMAEWTIGSRKSYADPFNDVDVDVVFTKDGQSWRVPTFWRGGMQWTVRFAPPTPGDYAYHLESTDPGNPDLNGHAGRVTITGYTGKNALLKHGMLRVSANRRYFEYADGTPFYWLADTWWTGLSDRLPWEGFQELAFDRKRKGFTVVLLCAGLVPGNEELEPVDPGFSNEGGAVWDPQFKRINPHYFDYADRRIQNLIDVGIVPAVVAGWYQVLPKIGIAQMKKHWRYLIGRYGAYPVFWVGGGEVYDPPEERIRRPHPAFLDSVRTPGWSEVFRYIRATDPYQHPLTVHDLSDASLDDTSLTDFDLMQPGHWNWPTLGVEVAMLNIRYARTGIAKPLVVGEVNYEMDGGSNLQDIQRAQFWLAMLNGAAGYTYGAAPTYEANNPDKPLHRIGQYTFLTWREGMDLPGSREVGLGAQLLQKYPWWQFAPHPEWVIPRGTTLLEPRRTLSDSDLGDPYSIANPDWSPTDAYVTQPETLWPGGDWKAREGTFRYPYAAGIPEKLRIIYIPYFGLSPLPPPTVLGLEKGVMYHAYYWEPMLGIKFDLGAVGLPQPGAVILKDEFDEAGKVTWSDDGLGRSRRQGGRFTATGETASVVNNISAKDIVVSVDGNAESAAGILLRYQNAGNYVAALYSPKERSLYLYTRSAGKNGKPLGAVSIPTLTVPFCLSAEVRSDMATASITDGKNTYHTPIVDVLGSSWWGEHPKDEIKAGRVGILHPDDGGAQHFAHFEVHQSSTLPKDEDLDRQLYDARGVYRGALKGPRWDEFGENKAILLNSYRPERFPTLQDWVLVLEAEH
jgi:Protein of unknown function (DUF4038)/Domain of unknown function (DUF5060)